MTGAEIAALASAAISAGSTVASGVSAAKANSRGVEYAEKENGLQRDFQRQMWYMQNEYNDPKNAMKRLKEAGINPHLYYGGNPQNQSAAVPSSGGGLMPSIRGIDYSGFDRVGQSILQSQLVKAQIDNINADTKKKETETTGQDLSNGITLGNLKNQPTSINLENQAKEAGIANTKESTALINAKIASEKQEVINKISTNEKIKQEVDNLIVQKEYTEQQVNNLIVSIAFTRAQIVTEYFKQKNFAADTELKRSQKTYNNELSKTQSFVRSNLSAQTANQNAYTKNLGKQYEILEENRQKANRENYIGNKYDLNRSENSYLQSSESINIMKQTYKNMMLDEEFKKLKITEQEFINANMMLDTGERVISDPMDLTSKIGTRGATSTTVTRFDRRGNYNGHTTTRRHR